MADLKQAITLYQKGDRSGALKALGQALDANPALAQDQTVQKLAARITGLPVDRAASLLRNPEQREAFIRKHGKRGIQPAANRGSFLIWGFGLVLVVIVALIAVYVLRQSPIILTLNTGQTERRTLPGGAEYHIVMPNGSLLEDGWPTLVAIHGSGQSGVDLVSVLGEATRNNGILLIAPTFPDLLDNADEAVYQNARNTILLILEDMQFYSFQQRRAAPHFLGQSYAGVGSGARFVSWLAWHGLDYADAGFTMDRPLGVALVNPISRLFDAPDTLIPYLITGGADSPEANRIRNYTALLQSQGVPIISELVPGTGETITQRQIDLMFEMVQRAYQPT